MPNWRATSGAVCHPSPHGLREPEEALFADSALSFEDLVADADQDISVEEILNAYSDDNSANEGGTIDTSPTDPVDSVSGSNAGGYVPTADIMNTIDDAGTGEFSV